MNNIEELIARCDGSFIPTKTTDFIGATANKEGSGALLAAKHIESAIAMARQRGNTNLKFLLNGKPGLGKSMLVNFALHRLGCTKYSTIKLNGTQVVKERLEEIAADLQYANIFGDYRALMVDEADEIPRVAQVRFLTLLDDLPKGTVVFCTSNCKLSDFENRFQTRFQAINITPPSMPEIAQLLSRFVDESTARQISLQAQGNVRAALLDALGVVQASSPVLATV
jgi:replication-associated recombination protein RarA